MDEQEETEIEAKEEDLETTDVSEPEKEEEAEEEPSRRRELLKSALLVLRDIGISLLVVLIVFLVLWAYSGVWPPIVVVESGSMQHDNYESHVGVIDTGDLVLVQKANSPGEIETYVHGQCSGHATYGDEGDVIIYNELGGGDKPIIHRALVWLKYNSTGAGSFDVPGLECNKWENGVNWWAYNYNGTGPTITITEPRNINGTLTIVVPSGHRSIHEISLDMRDFVSDIKADSNWNDGGFVALGDNNPDEDGHLIKFGWIIGRARGELPWFGLIKLSVTGEIPWGSVCSGTHNNHCAPQNSWDSLTIALVVLIGVPIVLDLGLGFYQRWRMKHPRPGEEEGEEGVEEVSDEESEHEEPSEEEAEESS